MTMPPPDMSTLTDDALIAEIERRCPDLVVAPRQASLIMTMRGIQAEGVFRFGEDADFVDGYLDLRGLPHSIHGFRHLKSVEDERPWLIAAAIWRGCVDGLEEWRRRRAAEGATPFITSWERPCVPNVFQPAAPAGDAPPAP